MASVVQILQLKIDAQGVVTGSVQAERALDRVDRAADKTGGGLDRFKGIAQGVQGALAAIGVGKFIADIVRGQTVIDRINRSLEVGAGSSHQAGAEYQFLRSEARRLGLDLETSAESYAKFTIATKGSRLEGEASRKVFSAVAGAMAATGGSAEQTQGALTALEQMVSKGTVSAEELRGQLGERLPGAFKLAARGMGVTESELNDMLQKGEVLAEDLLPRLAVELEREFGPAAESAADSMQGGLNRIATGWFELKTRIAEAGLGETIGNVFGKVAGGIEWLLDNWDALAAGVYTSIAGILRSISSMNKGANEGLSKFIGRVQDTLEWLDKFGLVPDRIKRFVGRFKGSFEEAGEAYTDFLDTLAEGLELKAEESIDRQVAAMGGVPAAAKAAAGGVQGLNQQNKQLAEQQAKLIDQFESLREQLDPNYSRVQAYARDLRVLEAGFLAAAAAGRALSEAEKERLRAALQNEHFQLDRLPVADVSLPTGPGYSGAGVNGLGPSGSAWEQVQGVRAIGAAFGEAEKRGDTFWQRMKLRAGQFADWLESDEGGSLISAAFAFGDALVQAFERSEPHLARLIAGVQNAVGGLMAVATASNAGQAAMGGMAFGSGLYQTGLFGDAGRQQGTFGGQLSGNYADVGSIVGGAIGAVVGAYAGQGAFSAQGAQLGTMIGSIIGGVVGSAIKSGADEGLAELRQVGREVSVSITKGEGGLGSVVQGIGREIADGLQRILSATGGVLDFVGNLDLKIRDDKISVFVNGIKRVFSEVSDAVSFALAELLRTAEISGLSENQQAVLQHARSQGPGTVNIEEIAGNLEFARAMDQLPLGDTARALQDLGDWFRVTMDRAQELGLTQETQTAILDRFNEAWREVGQTITTELDALAGRTTEISQAVSQYTDRVRDLVAGAREYNQTAIDEARSRRERIVLLNQELEAARAAEAEARARVAELREQHGFNPRIEQGDQPGEQPWEDFARQALEAGRSVAEITAELERLGLMTDQATIDIEGYVTDIIGESRNLFRDFTDQFLAGPADVFERQMEEFDDYRDAAADLRDANLELATTDEQRRQALQVYHEQLQDLAAAEEAYQRQFAQRTQLSLFEGLASLLEDGPQKTELMRQAEEMRYDLARAQLQLEYEALRVANEKYMAEHDGLRLVQQSTLDFIRDTLASLPEDKPGGGGGRGGGGRKERREDFLDDLRDRQRGPEGDFTAALRELTEWEAEAAKEAKKLGISLDEVTKASEAQRKVLADDANEQIREMRNPMSGAGRQILDIKKWRADMEKVAKELGLSLDDIADAADAGIQRIVQDVRRSVGEYADVFGGKDLRFALIDNMRTADDLRQSIEDLGLPADETAALLNMVTEAEGRRNDLLRQQAKIGFLESLDRYIDDQELSMELQQLKADLEIQSLRAQIEGLFLAGQLTEEQRARYEGWLTEAEEKIRNPPPPPPPPQGEKRADFASAWRGFRLGGDVAEGIVRIREQAEELRKKAEEAGLATEGWLRAIDAAEEQMIRYTAGQQVAGLFEGIAKYLTDADEQEALLREAAEIRYDLERELMRAQIESLYAQKAVTEETYDRVVDLLGRLPENLPPPPRDPGGLTLGQQAWLNQQQAQQWLLQQRQEQIEEFYNTLAGFRTRGPITPNEEFRQLLETFDGLRETAVRLGLDVTEVYEVQRQAVGDFFRRLTEGISDLRRELFFDEQLSSATVGQRYFTALGDFQDLRARIEAGDLSAIGEIGSVARLLQGLGRDYLASGAEYRALEAMIDGTLAMIEGLPGAMEAASDTLTADDINTPIVDAMFAADQARHADNNALIGEVQSVWLAIQDLTDEVRGQAGAGAN